MTPLALYLSRADLPERMLRARFYVSARGGHADDILQAGRLGLWTAAQRFRHELGEWEHFATSSVWGAMNREAEILRAVVRRSGCRFGTGVPVGVGLAESSATVAQPGPDTAEWLLRHARPADAELVRRVVIDGEAGVAIAAERGVSRQAVQQRVRRGLSAMRAAIELEAA